MGVLIRMVDFELESSGRGDFLGAGGEDGFISAMTFVLGSDDVADGRVQAHGVVVLDELGDEAAGWPDADRGAAVGIGHAVGAQWVNGEPVEEL